MATRQETHASNAYMNDNNIPVKEEEEEEEEEADFGNGCGCGWFRQLFCLGRRQQSVGNGGYNNDHRHLLQGRGDGDEGYVRGREGWLVQKLKKVKEVSEVVAGPKWKTWLRKTGAYLNVYKRKMGWGRGRRENNFQYDSYDYALNFDEGEDADDEDKFSFSARFAPPFHNQIQIQRPVAVAS
ncbi:hypothetical protein Ancab_006762 [Ancistrocladus abbreviatus]